MYEKERKTFETALKNAPACLDLIERLRLNILEASPDKTQAGHIISLNQAVNPHIMRETKAYQRKREFLENPELTEDMRRFVCSIRTLGYYGRSDQAESINIRMAKGDLTAYLDDFQDSWDDPGSDFHSHEWYWLRHYDTLTMNQLCRGLVMFDEYRRILQTKYPEFSGEQYPALPVIKLRIDNILSELKEKHLIGSFGTGDSEASTIHWYIEDVLPWETTNKKEIIHKVFENIKVLHSAGVLTDEEYVMLKDELY